MSTTFERTAKDRLDALLRTQEQQRADLVTQLVQEEREHAARLRAEINPEAGRAIVEAVEAVEKQIRADKRADRLLAGLDVALPSWMRASLPPLSAEERAEGRQRLIVIVPPPYAGGDQERIALGLIDVTDAVWGGGARAQWDDEQQERERQVQDHELAIQAEREREQARR